MSIRILNTIQMNCPHILRYLTCAVIISKVKRNKPAIKEIVRVLNNERNNYKDPITEFLLKIYLEFDFTGSSACLKECSLLLENDFFLGGIASEFIESARLLLFETHTRIHRVIDIDQLSKGLDIKSETETNEQVIVELIRQSKLEAKIDIQNNTINMTNQFPTIYQQVLDKTRANMYRATLLVNTIDKKLSKNTNNTSNSNNNPTNNNYED